MWRQCSAYIGNSHAQASTCSAVSCVHIMVAEAAAPVATDNGPKKDMSPAELFQMQLFGHLTGALTASLVGVGDKLGLYQGLKKLGKASSTDLAEACGINERFTREWLHQQVTCCLFLGQPVSHSAYVTQVSTIVS